MNRAAKGNRIERDFNFLLTQAGFVTNRAIRSRFNRNDIWGCFDVQAKHPDSRNFTLYFQISTRWKSGKALKEIEAFIHGDFDLLFMVRKKDRKDFEVKQYFANGDWRPIGMDFITSPRHWTGE